jgi:hypothetical protein
VRVGPEAYTFCRATKTLMAQRAALVRQMANRSLTAEQRAALGDRARALQRQARKAQRKDDRAHLVKQLRAAVRDRAGGDCRSFWRFTLSAMRGLKSVGASHALVAAPVRDAAGRLCTTPEDIMRVWTAHFRALAAAGPKAERSKRCWARKVPLPKQSRLPGINDAISWREVVEAVRAMTLGKAAGEDGVPPEALRALIMDQDGNLQKDEALGEGPCTPGGRALLHLVNSLFSSGVLPEEARSAVVVPVPKSGGDAREPNDYRGISLMSVSVKLACRIVAERLTLALVNEGRICVEQAGFMSREECMGQVCALVEAVQRRQRVGKATYAAFIDFRKAFDTVPHGALLHVAYSAGIRGRCLDFIRALYTEPTFRVRVGSLLSPSIPLQQGVRQGDPLSPILFDLFINTILDGVVGIKVHNLQERLRGLMFADDVCALAEDASSMRAALRTIGRWAKKWGMTINEAKCGLMVFSFPQADGTPHPEAVALQAAARAAVWPIPGATRHGATVPFVDKYKYLGVMLHQDLDFSVHVEHRCEQGRKALYAARSVLLNPAVPLHAKRTIYMTAVRPAIVYGSELLGGQRRTLFAPLQVLQTTAVRWMVGLGAGRRAAFGAALQADLGLLTISAVAAGAKARALVKYPDLRTVISTLVGGNRGLRIPHICPVDLWSSTGRVTISRALGAGWEDAHCDTVAKEVAAAVSASALTAALRGSESGKRYVSFGLSETAGYVRRSEASVKAAPGMAWLTRARCGVWTGAYQYAAQGKASAVYGTRCCACNSASHDTLEHITGSCGTYAAERARYLLPLWAEYRACAAAEGINVPASPPGAAALFGLAVGTSLGKGAACAWLGHRNPPAADEQSDASSDASANTGGGEPVGGNAAPAAPNPVPVPVMDGEALPLCGGVRAGFYQAALFFGAVLPAHRTRIMTALDSHARGAGAGHGMIPAAVMPPPGGGAAAGAVPDGADAANAVWPPAADADA